MVELIVGMAVTSILLVGLTGVLFSSSSAYRNWIDRIETSGTGDVLAAALAADSHRYVPCSASTTQLDFCLGQYAIDPVSKSIAPMVAVTYRNDGSAPYTVIRVAKVSPAGTRVMARHLPSQLEFRVTCAPLANVDVGFIKVSGLPGRAELDVHFQTVQHQTAPGVC